MRRSDCFPSKYLTAEDIPNDGMVVTIHHVEEEKMRDGKAKPIIYFEEVEKGMVCNVTNWKTIEGLYGEESDEWNDERIMLYASVTTFDEEEVPCIRIKKKAPKPAVKVAANSPAKGSKKTAEPLTQEDADAATEEDEGPPF